MEKKYPTWLYKGEEAIIVYSEEEDKEYSKEWMNSPCKENNTRVVKQKRGVSKDEV